MASARFAKLISEASSPFVVIPLFGLFITAHYSSSLIGFLGWYALFVLLAVGVPLGYVSWGAKARRVTDWHVIVHGQRLGPCSWQRRERRY